MKSKKINYKSILKRLEEIQVEKDKSNDIIIVIAEKQQDGTYWIAETNRAYKRKDFFLKGEDKFNDYIEKLDRENCTILIDDMLENQTKEISEQVAKHCTTEELETIVKEFEEIENKLGEIEIDKNYDTPEADKIIIKNIKEIAEGQK